MAPASTLPSSAPHAGAPAAHGPLEVRGVSVRAGETSILTAISLHLHPGELCGLIGPSGAGKSTLLKVLLGIRSPDRGEVRVGGKPLEEVGPVGYVPQRDALHRPLTVERALHYAALLRMPDDPEGRRRYRIEQVLHQVGLADRRRLRIGRLSLLILIAQAPIIGWLCTVVWASIETDTPSLYFVLCLAAVWFGCIGACREIVKERAIIERERLLGVGPAAVVLSKAQVLFGVGAAQAVLLQLAVEWRLALKGPYLVEAAALVLAAWCGTGLGLVVSALSARQDRAVAAVPLLLLPQVLFSEIAVPRAHFTGAVAVTEKLMPLRWAYRAFVDAAAVEPPWPTVAGSLAVLALYGAVLVGLAILALKSPREL